MRSIKLARYLLVALTVAILAVTWGCGSDGGSASNETAEKTATVSIIPSGSGEFVIQGDNLDGVSAIELTVTYDSATLASPSVRRGDLISGALMVANTNNPGTIRIAIVTNGVFSGSGQIASIAFARVTGTGNVSVTSVKLIDARGAIMNLGSAPSPGGTDNAGQPTVSTGQAQVETVAVSTQGNSAEQN